MIGKLKGIVDAIGESHCVIDVNGVGYEVQASARTLRNMKLREPASLAIDTHVREDAIRLFGFASEVERSWFRTLQNVQGVGSKVALGVLGTLSPTDLANAIALGNWQAVEQTPGVGKKLAQRIVAELKDKADSVANELSTDAVRSAALNGSGKGGSATEDAVSALVNLGYRRTEAYTAVAKAAHELGDKASLDGLIRAGLKELSQ